MSAVSAKMSPLIVSFGGLTNNFVDENTQIREALSRELTNKRERSVETVSNTIFPSSYWNRALDRQELFNRFNKCWPLIKRCDANKYGTYFRRFTGFENGEKSVNQLEWIIDNWNSGNHRHSVLQAAVFDPRKEHNKQRNRGFPCLQQVSFNAQGRNGEKGLTVTGFYANQTIFEKAYGNYLGLAHLGQFMATEMGLELSGVICISSVATVHFQKSKKQLESLELTIREIVNSIS